MLPIAQIARIGPLLLSLLTLSTHTQYFVPGVGGDFDREVILPPSQLMFTAPIQFTSIGFRVRQIWADDGSVRHKSEY